MLLVEHLFESVAQYGLIIVFANVLLNQIGLPLPAVPTLIVAGAIVGNGQLAFLPLLACGVLACCIADCLWYFIGRRYGVRVLKFLCRVSLEPDSCVSQTQSRFEKWGINSLLIAKFIPGLATVAPPLAGAMNIGWRRFLTLSCSGACLWVGFALTVGVLFKTQIAMLLAHLEAVGGAAAAIIGAALAIFVLFKWQQRRRFYRALRMARIDVSALYAIMQAGAKPLIVDVRSTTARALEPRGIPGAVHIPMDDIAKHLASLPRESDIVLYCSCPSEASAARVARLLLSHGFKNVRPLHGGLDAWVAAGYAVVGAEPAANPAT